MKRLTSTLYILAFMVVATFSGCDKNGNTVLFSIENDKNLGAQVSQEIANDPNFKLMDRAAHPEAYKYLDAMVTEILNSGNVTYRTEFPWQVTLVEDDETLNAFATPGGYIYVYTGLIKFLGQDEAQAADALAGVMGHEIAHADLRHTSRNLQKQYGVSLLLSVVLGNSQDQLVEIVGQIAGQVAGLSFSRQFESEADDKSVEYLSGTQYSCDGAKIFFESISDQPTPPEFLSTHPSPTTRVADITAKAGEENCSTELSNDVTGYKAFVASLP